jgi:hypothetical protein
VGLGPSFDIAMKTSLLLFPLSSLAALICALLCLLVTVRAADQKNYPLKKCVVSGEPLGGDLGKPVEVTYKGQSIQLCCKSCVKKFNANPEKYLAIYKAEIGKK